ncbi:MAG: DUF305 domain-containing protein [Pseudanabaenaceae cyanobacterium bins.68]|nr:DUF305 domain-containing protein [Pseudanabaenaceae cyanobacterium bins.68]
MKLKPFTLTIIALTTALAINTWHSSAQMGKMNHDMGGMSMELGAADANLDLRFIDGMVPHHQGAIAMAKEALQKSQRPEIKKLAQEIIRTQEVEITQMGKWRKSWYPNVGSTPMAWHSQMGHMMPMSDSQKKAMMMSADLGTADANFDLRFINAMILHHQAALMMAKEVQTKTRRPEIKKIAQEVLSAQQAEIAQMQQWRKSWYGK